MKVKRSSFPFFFFSKAEKKRLIDGIKAAELKTSAEIRIHLERRVSGDLLDYAQKKFVRLGMHAAREKNGVLIFFETAGRRFAVIGGQGIHEKLPADFWKFQTDRMAVLFREDGFAEGVLLFVSEIGALLAQYFPRKADDQNEFSDQISCSF